MGTFEELLQVYREDILISKIDQIYEKYKNNINHKKIVKRKKNIYWYDHDDKFLKFPNIIYECLLEVDFKAKDCFKVYLTILKNLQRKQKPYMACKKSFLLKQVKIKRLYLDVCLKELKDKKMLLEEKTDNFDFQFFLNIAPLTWNVIERENIEREVEREMERLEEKWINENAL